MSASMTRFKVWSRVRDTSSVIMRAYQLHAWLHNLVHASISAIIVWVMYVDCGSSCQQLPGSGCVVLGTTSVYLFESETRCKMNLNVHPHSEDVKAAARHCEHMFSQCVPGYFSDTSCGFPQLASM